MKYSVHEESPLNMMYVSVTKLLQKELYHSSVMSMMKSESFQEKILNMV